MASTRPTLHFMSSTRAHPHLCIIRSEDLFKMHCLLDNAVRNENFKPISSSNASTAQFFYEPLALQESLSFLHRTLITGKAEPAVFVSMDIREAIDSSSHIFSIQEVGISLLNTSDLEFPNPIQIHNFPIDSFHGSPNQKCPKQSNLGISKGCSVRDLPDLFRRILYGEEHPALLYDRRGARLVLVGHDCEQVLNKIERAAPGLLTSAPIVALIDTQILYGQLPPRTILERAGLGKGVEGGKSGCAGSDSHDALRAVIVAALRYRGFEGRYGEILVSLKQLAMGDATDLVQRASRGLVRDKRKRASSDEIEAMKRLREEWSGKRKWEIYTGGIVNGDFLGSCVALEGCYEWRVSGV